MRLMFSVTFSSILSDLLTMIMRYLGGCEICLPSIYQVSFLQQDQVLYSFCLCSSITNSWMHALCMLFALLEPLHAESTSRLTNCQNEQLWYFFDVTLNKVLTNSGVIWDEMSPIWCHCNSMTFELGSSLKLWKMIILGHQEEIIISLQWWCMWQGVSNHQWIETPWSSRDATVLRTKWTPFQHTLLLEVLSQR